MIRLSIKHNQPLRENCGRTLGTHLTVLDITGCPILRVEGNTPMHAIKRFKRLIDSRLAEEILNEVIE